jgi:mono/diheme cytochrome c family protein
VKLQKAAVGLLPLVLVACSPGESSPEPSLSSLPGLETPVSGKPVERWYAIEHVGQGEQVFQENCAACHGKLGEGAPDWKKVGADGKYPAPPLNGSGHAWHHPLKMLFHVVKNGSPGGQGNMPAWTGKLSDDEMVAAIAWFQSKWPDQIYSAWMQRELASRSKRSG